MTSLLQLSVPCGCHSGKLCLSSFGSHPSSKLASHQRWSPMHALLSHPPKESLLRCWYPRRFFLYSLDWRTIETLPALWMIKTKAIKQSREKGWRSGESTHLPTNAARVWFPKLGVPCWLGLVVRYSALRGFSQGILRFSPLFKNQTTTFFRVPS